MRNELAALQRELGAVLNRLHRWVSTPRPSPGAESFARLNRAAGQIDFVEVDGPERREKIGSLPVLDVLTNLVQVVRLAVEQGPRVRRGRHASSSRAVRTILTVLKRPGDEASQEVARQLHPSRSESKKSDFKGLVQAIINLTVSQE